MRAASTSARVVKKSDIGSGCTIAADRGASTPNTKRPSAATWQAAAVREDEAGQLEQEHAVATSSTALTSWISRSGSPSPIVSPSQIAAAVTA